MTMYREPTFILKTLRNYKSIKNTSNVRGKFDYLQDTAEVLTKYITVANLSILSEYDSSLFKDLSRNIFYSTSLGSWIEAIEVSSKKLQEISQTSDYGNFYLEYKNHSKKNKLKEIYGQILEIMKVFESLGLKVDLSKSYRVIDILKKFLFIRNKHAHFRPRDIELAKIIIPYFESIKQLLMIIKFDDFIFCGRDISHYCELVGENPKGKDFRGEHDVFFWAESPFLKNKIKDFELVYFDHDSQKVFFLNDIVSNKGEADYVCYNDKKVKRRRLQIDWLKENKEEYRDFKVDLDLYRNNKDILDTQELEWKEIDFDVHQYELLPHKGVIYYFYIEIKIFNVNFEHLLYIGRTDDLKRRVKEYLLIAKKYDDSRKEILRMFNKYENNVKFKYCHVSNGKKRENLEELIYKIFKPEANRIKPSLTDRG